MAKKFRNKRRLKQIGFPERYKKSLNLAFKKERKAERSYVKQSLNEATKLKIHEIDDFDLKPKDFTKITMWDIV